MGHPSLSVCPPCCVSWHSAFPVIYCPVANYPKTHWLKAICIYYLTVPMGQESRCDLSWVPPGLSQAATRVVAGALAITLPVSPAVGRIQLSAVGLRLPSPFATWDCPQGSSQHSRAAGFPGVSKRRSKRVIKVEAGLL